MHRYLVVIEEAAGNFSAYSPDLPGCVATGQTREEVTRHMQEAIELHIQGIVEDELPIPVPRTFAEYITVSAGQR
jgi:predicted RNase H-like HicB family nuclease